jgi:hypothetical protein
MVDTTKDLSLITYPVLARDFRCGAFLFLSIHLGWVFI